MTLGNAAVARVRLIVWCRQCWDQVEPDPAEMVERYGADDATRGAAREKQSGREMPYILRAAFAMVGLSSATPVLCTQAVNDFEQATSPSNAKSAR
jgi:hypothetical protein